MNRYYIAEMNKKQFSAANKAREDIEVCFKQCNYERTDIYLNIVNSKNPKITTIKELISSLIKFKVDDYIYIQYPYYNHCNKINFIIKSLKTIKKVNLVCIIHDIDSLRYKDSDNIKKEIEFINIFDYIISHNEKMSKWLIKNGCTSNIINLDIFDYLLQDEDREDTNIRKTDIVFAGNLDQKKSKFVYKLAEKEINYSINLYGPNFEKKVDSNKNIKYCGKFAPEELVQVVEGKFGLIWDGEELDSCSGDMGEYTKYNNPHKMSLYIASGLPIICWNKMAIAEFIIKNKIGIVVESLEELNSLNIGEKEYQVFLENIKVIQHKVKIGEFTKNALNKINN